MKSIHESINRLPELPLEPFEVAGKLAHADRGPFLTIKPHDRPAPIKPEPKPLAVPRSQFETRRYFTQVLYPRLICHDPGDLLVNLPQSPPSDDAGGRPETDVMAIARQERSYKLSALNGVKLPRPYWCSVRYGPWLAIATERESCIEGEANFWELFIVEVPEVALAWFGRWEDIPPYPSLTVIMGDLVLAGRDRQCCPGYKWCTATQSCIPNAVNCPDTVPA
jgi:hypothetical protein